MFCLVKLTAGQNHSKTIAEKTFEKVAKFRYLVMVVRNCSCVH